MGNKGTSSIDAKNAINQLVQNITEENARTAFNAYDKDKNGSLSKKEFEKFAESYIPNTTQAHPDETFEKFVRERLTVYMFNEIDTDGNGIISFDEFWDYFNMKIRARQFENAIESEFGVTWEHKSFEGKSMEELVLIEKRADEGYQQFPFHIKFLAIKAHACFDQGREDEANGMYNTISEMPDNPFAISDELDAAMESSSHTDDASE